MAELLRLLAELLERLAPVVKVSAWEAGVVAVWGRYWRTVGPGIYPVIPWLVDIHHVSMVPSIHGTALQTITLRDRRALTFSATVTIQVDDAAMAWNTVERYSETTMELVSALLAEHLADVDPDRFDPARGKRDRLLAELAQEADAETQKFGVRVLAIRFGNFAVGVRTLRLLTEPAVHLAKA
jgi:regulator of protease activity HflC (stomatin/prohibitin superfamily)